jgi:mannose-1-phosphate guanylyltransferase
VKRAALILAGGKGERLWPLSQPERPKQFLTLTQNNRSLLQLTVQRITSLVSIQDIFIITGSRFVGLVKEQIPEIPEAHIIQEPCGRNTAPAIALSLLSIQQAYGSEDVTVMVFPSDHLIEPEDAFVATLTDAVTSASQGNIVTIGIKPTYPETGFGYLKAKPQGTEACPVERFVEKPDKETAQRYLEDGTYFWNAGMFVFPISLMKQELQRYVPEVYSQVERLVDADGVNETTYGQVPSISIDYAVMEKSTVVKMVPARFSWDDVGSFLALTRHYQQDEAGNTVVGAKKQVVLSLSHNNIIDVQEASTKQIILIGVDDCTIIENQGTLLICANSHVPEIQQLLKQKGEKK